MSNLVLKAVVFVSLAASALFVLELALMWSLLREDGVKTVLDRRFVDGFDMVRELCVLAVSLFWIKSKIPLRGGNGADRRTPADRNDFVNSNISRSEEPLNTQSWDDDSDSADLFSESSFDDPFDDSTNPANGLPMMGGFDIEGNAYGTDSIADDFAMDHSDSIFDDTSSFSDDSWL